MREEPKKIYRSQEGTNESSFFPVHQSTSAKKPGLVRRAIDFMLGRKKPQAPLVPVRTRERVGAWEDTEQTLLPDSDEIIRDVHAGMGIGSRERPDMSAENARNWAFIGERDVVDFIYRGKPLSVHSSNVRVFQYDISKKELFILFKNGGKYVYSSIDPREAYQIIKHWSKGVAVWDYLRIRGTRYGHRKPYRKVN